MPEPSIDENERPGVPRIFGTLADGEPVRGVWIGTDDFKAHIIEWGAVLRDLRVGRTPLVLGLSAIGDYVRHSPHFGAMAGRYANRIARGRVTLDRETHQLDLNEGRHHLHGGPTGFGKRVWTIERADEASATLRLVSEDGDQGYPGRCVARTTYSLRAPSTLRVEVEAEVDRTCPVSIAHHSYFNLDGGGSCLDHELTVLASHYTPVDEERIPTGEIAPVAGTVFDFREAATIGARKADYDINFALDGQRTSDPRTVARVRGARTGTTLDVRTTEAGLQFYDAARLSMPVPGLDGQSYGPNAGFCLEPQHFPDAPNRRGFPDPVLRPGERYRQISEYAFNFFPS